MQNNEKFPIHMAHPSSEETGSTDSRESAAGEDEEEYVFVGDDDGVWEQDNDQTRYGIIPLTVSSISALGWHDVRKTVNVIRRVVKAGENVVRELAGSAGGNGEEGESYGQWRREEHRQREQEEKEEVEEDWGWKPPPNAFTYKPHYPHSLPSSHSKYEELYASKPALHHHPLDIAPPLTIPPTNPPGPQFETSTEEYDSLGVSGAWQRPSFAKGQNQEARKRLVERWRRVEEKGERERGGEREGVVDGMDRFATVKRMVVRRESRSPSDSEKAGRALRDEQGFGPTLVEQLGSSAGARSVAKAGVESSNIGGARGSLWRGRGDWQIDLEAQRVVGRRDVGIGNGVAIVDWGVEIEAQEVSRPCDGRVAKRRGRW